jgi:hypothetical protein
LKRPKSKITISLIQQYIEGNIRMLGDALKILPVHEIEQIRFRAEICKNDCVKYGYCVNCGCELPGKFYVKRSCNAGGRFPDLMNADEWDKYKKDNNINFE